jgi:hypothetical protein
MSRARCLLLTALCAGLTALSVRAAEPVLASEPKSAAEQGSEAEPRMGLVREGGQTLLPPPAVPSMAASAATAGNALPALAPPRVDPVSESFAMLRQELADARLQRAALEDSNARLTELNAQLRQEIESLAIELQTTREQGERRALLYGAGLILAGLLVGVLLRRRPRNSVWN